MEHAKAAVKLDMCDGYSWYQVGMAYMSLFFAEARRWITRTFQLHSRSTRELFKLRDEMYARG